MGLYPYRQQPLKGLYLTYQLITTLFLRIPFWILVSLPRSLRPRESWNLKRSVLIRLTRHLIHLTSQTGPIVVTPDHLAIVPFPKDKDHIPGVWVPPASSKYIVGSLKQWAAVANVSPIKIPGYWQHKKGSTIQAASPPTPGEKVILSLHGGAYIRLSAHPGDVTANIGRGLLKHVDSVQRVFTPEYRLSAAKPWIEANPFPSALLDALAGYQYLVDEIGFSPSDIVITGDSAGGNLAHALTRYLIENQDALKPLGPPGSLLLLSPWVDITRTVSTDYPNLKSDYLPHEVVYASTAFTGSHGLGFADRNPYISPASKALKDSEVSFVGFPRTFIVVGGAEVLYEQIVDFKERMVKSLGSEKVRWYEAKDAVHDYITMTFHEPERTETLKAIAEWLR